MGERNYDKLKKKTNPTSVRFNIEDLDFCMQETGKRTKQELVDFLLSDFKFKKENGAAITPSFPSKKEITHAPIQRVSQYDAYYSDLQACNTCKEIEVVMNEANKDKELTGVERVNLDKMAKEMATDISSN
jgi:hypothetical protein